MENYKFSKKMESNYSLSSKHLFKKKAGNSKYYYQLDFNENLENDLKAIARFAKKENILFKIFGMHSNIYITDNGFDGLFVDISPKNGKIEFDKDSETFKVTGNLLTSRLVNFTMEKGYDFAALTGIPGMVGSGIVGNAGWTPTKKSFSNFVKKIILFDFESEKEIEVIPDENFFSARNSKIKEFNKNRTVYIVIGAVLKAEYIGKENVKVKVDEQIKKRRKSLQAGYKDGCAGSIWANPILKTETGKTFPEMLKENESLKANFNGARYGDEGSMFFTTGEETTDKDVAKLFVFTLEKLRDLYHVKPKMELLILDYDGEIDLDTFIQRNYNNI